MYFENLRPPVAGNQQLSVARVKAALDSYFYPKMFQYS
jgi:hypothetical protein